MIQENATTSLTNNKLHIPKKNEKQKRNTLRRIRKLEIGRRMFKCNAVKEATREKGSRPR